MAFQISSACTGCTACARSCPVFAITGERGAQHSINSKRCVECGVCGRLCPKAAIADAQGRTLSAQKRSEWAKPRIDRELCSACSICVDYCSAGALRITLPLVRGDLAVGAELAFPQKCVACSLCQRHCPLGAITMEVPAPAQAAVSATGENV
jgi:formate hydrogenlyase subunit 6/NADH:ubiquinone oxidoreductase subunit I